MSVRVTATEVKEIINTDLSDSVVETFISAANLTISKWLGDNSNLSSSQLKEIERWFTAHLIACTKDQQPLSEKTGDASIKYQGETGKGLKATFYGQQCLILDTTGILASNSGKRKATIRAITSFE